MLIQNPSYTNIFIKPRVYMQLEPSIRHAHPRIELLQEELDRGACVHVVLQIRLRILSAAVPTRPQPTIADAPQTIPIQATGNLPSGTCEFVAVAITIDDPMMHKQLKQTIG
jgi:hypothetical protein